MAEADRSLTELLEAARDGEAGKKDDLFQACRSYLDVVARGKMRTWLRAKVDSSDLVQQTMLEAHRDFERFQGRTTGEWLAWLRRILNHNAADFARRYVGTEKRALHREVRLAGRADESEQQGGFEPAAGGASPSQMLVEADIQAQMAAALERLAPDHQEVIFLRNFERLPFDQVASRMGRTRPAVQMLWMRAIKKLQAEMPADASVVQRGPEGM